MTDDPKPKLLLLPGEIEIDLELFERSPLRAIKRYLECFTDQGQQVYAVPQHILEEIARRCLTVMAGQYNSLDEAFGGRVARQRNAFRAQDAAFSVSWDIFAQREKARELSSFERSKSIPSECALVEVGKKRGMGPDNVRRTWKKAGKPD